MTYWTIFDLLKYLCLCFLISMNYMRSMAHRKKCIYYIVTLNKSTIHIYNTDVHTLGGDSLNRRHVVLEGGGVLGDFFHRFGRAFLCLSLLIL